MTKKARNGHRTNSSSAKCRIKESRAGQHLGKELNYNTILGQRTASLTADRENHRFQQRKVEKRYHRPRTHVGKLLNLEEKRIEALWLIYHLEKMPNSGDNGRKRAFKPPKKLGKMSTSGDNSRKENPQLSEQLGKNRIQET